MNLEIRILELLKSHQLEFRYLTHGPTPTCEDSAQARGIEQKFGGKTLLVKDKHGFKLFTLSAAKSADSKKMRALLGSQKLRFATPDELKEIAGVEKGALPPLGSPILELPLYLDHSLRDGEWIAFNPGNLCASVILKTSDYLKLVPSAIHCDFTL